MFLCSTVQIKLLINLDKVDWKTSIWSESGAVLLHLCPQCWAGWENQEFCILTRTQDLCDAYCQKLVRFRPKLLLFSVFLLFIYHKLCLNTSTIFWFHRSSAQGFDLRSSPLLWAPWSSQHTQARSPFYLFWTLNRA